MAVDKLVDSAQLDEDLASVADAIRAKSGGSSSLAFPSGFVREVGDIEQGEIWDEVTISTSGAVTQALDAGVFYHFTGSVSSLTLTLNAANGRLANYIFDFESGSTAPTLTLPNTIKMPDGFTVEANKIYEVNILNNRCLVASWSTP